MEKLINHDLSSSAESDNESDRESDSDECSN